jgi:hypothetical protein
MYYARWMVLLLALVSVVALGCSDAASSASSASVQVEPVTQTPEDVVRDFFLALGRHETDAMESLMSAYMLEESRTWIWSDNEADVRFDMTGLIVSATQPASEADLASRPERYLGYFAVRTGTVEYTQLNDSMTSSAGPQLRFVIVVKETSSSPWRLEEIGTGP